MPGQVAVERGVWSPRLRERGWRAEVKGDDFTGGRGRERPAQEVAVSFVHR